MRPVGTVGTRCGVALRLRQAVDLRARSRAPRRVRGAGRVAATLLALAEATTINPAAALDTVERGLRHRDVGHARRLRATQCVAHTTALPWVQVRRSSSGCDEVALLAVLRDHPDLVAWLTAR